jgi:GMP synthase (glutamine-hydrolysing)
VPDAGRLETYRLRHDDEGAPTMLALEGKTSARVLVVEHEPGAGPEMFRPWLASAGVDVDVCRPYAGDALPRSVGHDGLLVLGGSMGAHDDQKAPWLAEVRTMLADTTAQGLPVLGICLGAQLLAAACGGLVEPSPSGGELGLGRIDLNEEALADRLFAGLASPVEAVQAHEDDITRLPDGAVLLASSALCRVQAYRIGHRAWGVQFHPEASAAVLQAWADAEADAPPSRRLRLTLAVADVRTAEDRLFRNWQELAVRFAAVVKGD